MIGQGNTVTARTEKGVGNAHLMVDKAAYDAIVKV